MAKSWSGFLPQNQAVKEQWGLLEATQSEIGEILSVAPPPSEENDEAREQTEEIANFFRAHRPPSS
jgi:hypothetical protein